MNLITCAECSGHYYTGRTLAHRFVCDDCGSAYSSPETLAYHRKTKHKEAS